MAATAGQSFNKGIYGKNILKLVISETTEHHLKAIKGSLDGPLQNVCLFLSIGNQG